MARTSEALDPVGYTAAVSAAATVLGAHAVGLDGLGVTPDPGGGGEPPDPAAHGTGPGAAQPGSGSDLAATLEAAAASAEGRGSFAEVGSSMARAATSAASGPAGAGLAAFLAGMSEALANADRLDGPRFALCLEAGAERLAPRDDGRHPGGFVAVASAAADAALDAADRGSSLGETVLAAANAGIEELEKGPVLDPRLAECGSVDPAAAGFLLMLDSLASVITGEPLPEPPGSPHATGPSEPVRVQGESDPSAAGSRDTSMVTTRFHISCRLFPHDGGVEARAELDAELHGTCETHRLDTRGGYWEVDVLTGRPGAVVELLASTGTMRETDIGLDPAPPPAERPGEPTPAPR